MGNSQSTGHIDTVLATVARRYERLEARQEQKRGFVTLMELSVLGEMYGINPTHIGILWVLDETHDGCLTLEKLKRFAREAYKQTRHLDSRETAYTIRGACTLSLWYSLQQPLGRTAFVDWMLAVCCQGYERDEIRDQPYVETGALKVMHTLCDMQRSQGVVWRSLYDCVEKAEAQQEDYVPFKRVQAAAGGADKDDGSDAATSNTTPTTMASSGSSSRGVLSKEEGGASKKHRWVPLRMLQVIAEGYAEGIVGMLGQFLGGPEALGELQAWGPEATSSMFGVGGALMLGGTAGGSGGSGSSSTAVAAAAAVALAE